jgi:FkbM family methyltransferase
MIGRDGLFEWLQTSRALSPLKSIAPVRLKDALKRLLSIRYEGVIDLGNGSSLIYNKLDQYWRRNAGQIRDYEPECWVVMDRFLDSSTIFVDCGANLGLWSCYASAEVGNRNQVIAVEPSEAILPLLRRNWVRNNRKFTLLERAVWRESGESLEFRIYPAHVSGSLKDVDSHPAPARRLLVTTVCVDDIVAGAVAAAPGARNVIVKLDVEGAEQEAIEGASATLAARNVLIIFEDHGRDPRSETTAFCLRLGLNVYRVDPDTGQVLPVGSVSELRAIKTHASWGYNFLACMPGTGFDAALRKGEREG